MGKTKVILLVCVLVAMSAISAISYADGWRINIYQEPTRDYG